MFTLNNNQFLQTFKRNFSHTQNQEYAVQLIHGLARHLQRSGVSATQWLQSLKLEP
jgi:hypothetical protein